ncbi:MAG: AraC family transcriptional regulator, partial [Pseudomonadota bacterium]
LFSDCVLPPALHHTERRHLFDGSTHLNLERCVFGHERGREEDGKNLIQGPGEIYFSDDYRLYDSHSTERRAHNVTAPRALLGVSEDAPFEFQDITERTAIGRLVFAEWNAIFEALQRGDNALPQSQTERLAACFKIATGVHPQREDVRAHAREALFRQICGFIEARLEDPNLSTSTLLSQFGVSRATLYRMFEPLGGVRNYVTERRAASALFFISKSEGRRGFVQAACERWGFSSPANFNRTIQRLFGNSPKALLFARDAVDRKALSLTNFVEAYCAHRYQGGGDGLSALAA